QAERSATVAEARVRSLLEEAPDAIVVVTRSGQITLVNRQTELLFGYTRAELLHQGIELLVPERLRSLHQRHRQRYATHPRTRPMGTELELWGRRKDGSEFPVQISLSSWETAGEGAVIGTIRDVTELKAAERLKDEFIALAAHELRTPTSALKGYASMLRRRVGAGTGAGAGDQRPPDTQASAVPTRELAAWQEEAVEAVGQAAGRLGALTEDLLDATRLQAGRLELRPEPHDLVALVRRVLRRLQVTTTRHTLTLQAAPDLSWAFFAVRGPHAA